MFRLQLLTTTSYRVKILCLVREQFLQDSSLLKCRSKWVAIISDISALMA